MVPWLLWEKSACGTHTRRINAHAASARIPCFEFSRAIPLKIESETFMTPPLGHFTLWICPRGQSSTQYLCRRDNITIYKRQEKDNLQTSRKSRRARYVPARRMNHQVMF